MDAPGVAVESNRRQVWLCALGLTAASLLLRLWIVSQTKIISRDGLYYTDVALMINTRQWLLFVGDWFLFNPYPALLAAVARCGVSYDLAGQLVCAVAAGLAVLPLWAWCRRAFDDRVALAAAAVYILHPVLLRTSGQVYREGLFWLLLLSATALFWEAVQRGGWWRFTLAGLCATGATLTRMEGALLYLLAAGWWLMMRVERPAWRVRGMGLGWAALVLPLTLIALNVALIPPGQGWRGGGRFFHLAGRLLAISSVEPSPAHVSSEPTSPAASTPAVRPPPADVRVLANSLPIWTPEGVPNIEQQRLRRFLILAEDQQLAIYVSKFCSQCWQGLTPCVVLWLLYAAWRCRAACVPSRDLPLAVYSAALILLLGGHLASEKILENRYLFCLLPALLPWAAAGLLASLDDLHAWLARRLAQPWRRPALATALCLLALGAVAKGSHSLNSDKLAQRTIGERLRPHGPGRITIAGPESLRRIGHYADSTFLIIPRDAPARDWLDTQPIDYLVLAPEADAPVTPAELDAGAYPRYRRIWEHDLACEGLQVYEVLPPVRQWGS